MKIRKGQIFIVAFLFLVFGAIVAIQYFHFRGIKDSLERLVDQKTKGQYKLDLGETKYDFIKLDFSARNAHIYRFDTLNEKRIYTVELPYIRINLGSLESYFSFGQINVKEFEITEPVVLLKKGDKALEEILLSSELSKLLGIINEILDSFNIHSFKITKGAFDMTGDDQNLRVNLIDFLAKEWNVRKLTKESQINIKVGGQQVELGDHIFSFDQIEYKYSERQLTVSDFSYHHRDTLTGADLYASGDTFIIYHVDWKELSSSDRYKLKRIELINPKIRGSFPLPKGKRKDNDFFKMLYSTIGDLLVDSLIVREAGMRLSYKQKSDSTSVSFKNANFSATDFQLLNSKEYFDVGEVRFNLNQTELVIGKDYVLRFDSLLYNRHLHHRLRVTDLELSKYTDRKPFLTARQTRLSKFNPFDFMMNRRIDAESLELDHVSLNIIPEFLNLKSDASEPYALINLEAFKLSHADLYYSDKERNVIVKDLNVQFDHIQIGKFKRPAFEFDRFKIGDVTYQDAKTKVDIHIISLSDKNVFAKSLNASQSNGLSIAMHQLAIDFDPLDYKVPDHFKSVHADEMKIQGTLVQSESKDILPEFAIDQLSVDTVSTVIKSSINSIKFQALEFSMNGIRFDSISYLWNSLKTDVHNFSFENSDLVVTTRTAYINSQIISKFENVELLRKDSSIILQATSLSTEPFANKRYLSGAALVGVTLKVQQKKISAQGAVDSISLKELSFEEKLHIKNVAAFHPTLDIVIHNDKQQASKSSIKLPEQLEELILRNGSVTMKKESLPTHISNLDVAWKRESTPHFSFDSLTTKAKDFSLVLTNAEFNPEELNLNKISITPLEDFIVYSSTGYERDWLKMHFDGINAKGYLLDSLVYGKELDINNVQINSFQIDAFRDKRLPDPEFKEKDLFSGLLHKSSKPINIQAIHFGQGSVTIKQISDKTQETGLLVFNTIGGDILNLNTSAKAKKNIMLNATTQVFGQGKIKVNYEIEHVDKFKLAVTAEDLDLTVFNQIVQPLQSLRFKSGQLKSLSVNAYATDTTAVGTARITYSNARIEILDTDRSAFRNEIVSAIANEVIRNKRKNVGAPFTEKRDAGKSEFAYWVKLVLKGASTASRHGKRQK